MPLCVAPDLPAVLCFAVLAAPTCLQGLLRHWDSGHPPPLALTRELALHAAITGHGAYAWQMHVIAALADAQLAVAAAASAAVEASQQQAAPAAGPEGSGDDSDTWGVLQRLLQAFDPLPGVRFSCWQKPGWGRGAAAAPSSGWAVLRVREWSWHVGGWQGGPTCA